MEKLQTERLLLRDWSMADADDLYDYAKSPSLANFLGWKPHANPKESQKIIQAMIKMSDTWAIVLKETGQVIGSVSLHVCRHPEILHDCELRVVISEKYQNRGLGKEAAVKVITYAFDIYQISTLMACFYGTNASARGLLEGCGFRYYKHMDHFVQDWQGTRFTAEVYLMSRTDYQRAYK